MAYRDEIDDAFDAVVFLEERFYDKGYQEGFQDGKLKGHQEGQNLGLLKGCEVGGEVGFYLGFVSLWLEILLERSDAKPRCVKLLEILKKMILALPINDPTNEESFAHLEKIRAKFRQEPWANELELSDEKSFILSRKRAEDFSMDTESTLKTT